MQACKLVLTRPRQQAGEWLERLAALGVSALSLPLIEILPADGRDALAAWGELPGAALAVFVSPNAVEQFFARRPPDAVWPENVLAACVGPGSAAALRLAGVPAERIVQPPPDSPSLDSEHLWPELAGRNWNGRTALLLRGDGGRDWLAERLRERGAITRYFGVYQRRCPTLDEGGQVLLDSILATPQSHTWLFSSAEAIGHLQSLVPAAQNWSGSRCICTHERIVRAAQRAGFGLVVLARPDAPAVVQAHDAMQGRTYNHFHRE